MSQPQKIITFFIDRCLGSIHIAETLRQAGIAVEIHDDRFPQNAEDTVWIPEVGKKEWVILTKDGNISKNTLERMAVASAGLKMFVLAAKNLTGQDMAQILLSAIVKMQEFVRKHQAPFIAKIYRDERIEMWKDSQALLEELQQYSTKILNEGDGKSF